MSVETLHEALASIGLNSRPHFAPGKREIFHSGNGEIVGPMSAKEAWDHVNFIRSEAT